MGFKLSLSERISLAAAARKTERENERVSTYDGEQYANRRYQLPGVGLVVFRRLTPQGWPVFNKASDPTYFGPLTVQGEAGSAFANWAREKGLA